jgi:hypothetical protein
MSTSALENTVGRREPLRPNSNPFMSPTQPTAAATDSPANISGSRDDNSSWVTPPERQASPREIVRLFQCRVCSQLLEEPISLPCGRSICRRCMPETYDRVNISYPADPERLQGFLCPFEDCGKEHAVRDCSLNVILNKAFQHVKNSIGRRKGDAAESGVSTAIITEDEWAIAGVPSLGDRSSQSQLQAGGALLAAWILAEAGTLKYDAEVTYRQEGQSTDEDLAKFEVEALHEIQDVARTEMDCHICYALFYDPLTTSCGHTFCRSCLHRILDHSQYCPICRRKLAMNPLLNRVACPSNDRLSRMIEIFWIDELQQRKEALEAEQRGSNGEFDIALFVCTLSFPLMPTFLHIFEPRYRLMIRRALEGNRTFGMVLPKNPAYPGDRHFYDLGTVLRITDVQFYADGRSLVETIGISRFKVLEHGSLDGYAVGKIERIDDVSLEEEEAIEAQEVSPASSEAGESPGDKPASPQSDRNSLIPVTVEDVETMTTKRLMEYALDFVNRMRARSVPWLQERMLTIYGPIPEDPIRFPWWLANILPVKDTEKYRLMGTSSVRDRLKICCSWIVEWDTSSW